MNSKRHQKHPSLSKPLYGKFGRNEISVLGTSRGRIKQLADKLIRQLSPMYKLAYVDKEHDSRNHNAGTPVPENTLFYTDKQQSRQFHLSGKKNDYLIKAFFDDRDLVIVNGNHFSAERKIIVADSAENSEWAAAPSSNVVCIILPEDVGEAPGYLRQFSEVPVYRIEEIKKIAERLEEIIKNAVPPVCGLVLAGGKSTRMNTDKTVLDYHGIPQRDHLYKLLSQFSDKVYISCRPDQEPEIEGKLNCITDSFLEMGPLGALLSAFRYNPNTAWLAAACDLPLLSPTTLQYLLDNRNPSKIATAFKSGGESSFPEPLITIWEPKSYPVLLDFLGLGYSCPRKTLINSDIELLTAPKPRELMNVNRPDEYKEVIELLAVS